MHHNTLKFLIVFLITFSALSQDNNIIYFDDDWKETTKNNAAYYRNLPLQVKDNLVLIKDYYISGAIQMQGWAEKDNLEIYQGETKWYYSNGKIQYQRNFKDGNLDGEEKYYNKEGILKRSRHYKEGLKEGEQRVFDNKGSLIAAVIFKNDAPYQGTLFKKRREKTTYTSYEKGEKVAEEIRYKGKTIVNGNYVNGKAHSGTFLSDTTIHGWHCSKITALKKGKEEGKQVFMRIKDSIPFAYYYAKNGVKHGEHYDYNHDTETAYSLYYKNGKPIKGELLTENEDIYVYKKGKLAYKKVKVAARGFDYYNIYKNAVKTGVEYQLYNIDGKTKQVGTYQNGKPYQGYFLEEFPIPIGGAMLNYYEKGKKKYQYFKARSLTHGEIEALITVPFKSIYKEGKIYTGAKFKQSSPNNITISILEEGEIKALSIWVFSMHYGNNIVFKKINEGMEIVELKQPDLKILVDKTFISLVHKDSIISQRNRTSINNLANTYIKYFIEEGVLKTDTTKQFSLKAYETINDRIQHQLDRSDFLVPIYGELTSKDPINYVFNKYGSDVFNSKEEQDYIAAIYYNDSGKPQHGIVIEEENSLYTIKLYIKGELKVSKQQLIIKGLKKEITKTLRQFEEDW